MATNCGGLKLLLKTVVLTPAGVKLKVEPLPLSDTTRFPEASKASPKGRLSAVAKVVLVPLGANLKMEPVLESASKRLPVLSKARPAGAPSPVANVVFVPAGVIW